MSILSTFPRPFLEGTSKQIEIILPASAWSGTEAPYTQTIAVDGITPRSNGDLGLSQKANTIEIRNMARAAQITVASQSYGEMTIIADGEKPAADIPLVLTIFPKAVSEGDETALPAYDPSADKNKILIVDKNGNLTWATIGLDTNGEQLLTITLDDEEVIYNV